MSESYSDQFSSMYSASFWIFYGLSSRCSLRISVSYSILSSLFSIIFFKWMTSILFLSLAYRAEILLRIRILSLLEISVPSFNMSLSSWILASDSALYLSHLSRFSLLLHVNDLLVFSCFLLLSCLDDLWSSSLLHCFE